MIFHLEIGFYMFLKVKLTLFEINLLLSRPGHVIFSSYFTLVYYGSHDRSSSIAVSFMFWLFLQCAVVSLD